MELDFREIITATMVLFAVIDIVGRKLIEQKIATNNKQLTIDVSSLAKGTYLLNIIDDGNNSIQKFIKE